MTTKLRNSVHSVLGARKRGRTYEGRIVVQNILPDTATLGFRSTFKGSQKVCEDVFVESGESFTLDLGPTKEFDYKLTVNGKAFALVVRGASYELKPDLDARGGITIMEIEKPKRSKGNKLSSTPGLSFSFSGSGFLVVYQLGAAQYLQDQGIAQNPYVRVSGCSGGAMTVFSMMYGADLMPFLENVKDMAWKVLVDPSSYSGMRQALINTLASFWRDGSLEHPVFKEGRFMVCYAATSQGSLSIALDALIGRAKAKRVSSFTSPAEMALALLASGTAFFTGLPFVLSGVTSQPGPEKVADGGFVDNLPKVDGFSITVKPFSAKWDILNATGATPDVAPTEYVPARWGVYPPDIVTLDHLFELGYRDMEAWIDAHLDQRLATIQQSGSLPLVPDNLPPVEFVCADEGMQWLDEVLQAVPMEFTTQCKESLGLSSQRRRPSASALSSNSSSDGCRLVSPTRATGSGGTSVTGAARGQTTDTLAAARSATRADEG